MPQPAAARTITYKLTEPEAIAYCELVGMRQVRRIGQRRSWLSAVYMPVLLGAVLMTVATVARADPGPILAVATIAYLCGVLALRYEIMREYRQQVVAVTRNDPLYQWARHVTLGDGAVEVVTGAHMSTRFDYAAFTDFEVSRGLILGWTGNGAAIPVPMRAFASTGEASAFADDLCSRIAAARADERDAREGGKAD